MEETNTGSCLINFILAPIMCFCLSSPSRSGRKFGRTKNHHNKSVSSCCFCFGGCHARSDPPSWEKGLPPSFESGKVVELSTHFLQTVQVRCCAPPALCLLLIAWDFSEETWRLLQNSQVSKPLSLLQKHTSFNGANRFCFKKKVSEESFLMADWNICWEEGPSYSLFIPVSTKHFLFSI